MEKDKDRLAGIVDFMKTYSRKVLIVGATLGLPILMLAIFGFSIKTTPEYDCAVSLVENSRAVTSLTGTPIQPGFFAWTRFFESGGFVRQGAFSTSISGPWGHGRIQVSFYRAPAGSTLGIWFLSSGDEMEVYNGAYPCDD